MFAENSLANKTIIVTGGGSGLGKAFAEGFFKRGAKVYICGRREGRLQETVQEIDPQNSGRINYRVLDIRDPESIEAVVADIWAEGPVTGLVNNAGANFISPTIDISPRGYQAIRSTIMDGSYYMTIALGKRWIENGVRGSVVSNLVTWVWTGSAYVVPATMAKTAIDAMTKSLAVEWGKFGIRVNAVAPGPFPTDGAWDKLNPTGKSTGATDKDSVPLKRYGDIPELVNLLTFLLADGCDYITGQTVGIDGGHHLAGPNTFASLNDFTDQDWEEARAAIKASVEKEKQEQGKA